MHHVSGSMSANTGIAPTYTSGAAVATHVDSGTITSSPGPMPSARMARCSAEVQCGTAAAWRDTERRGELPLELADRLAGLGVPVVGRGLGDVAGPRGR